MAAQHTPGPWITQPSNSERWSQIVRPIFGSWPYDNVAYIQEMNDKECTNIGAHIANARLIAAAPDLLEALTDVIGWVPGGIAFHTNAAFAAVERARAAIAKAKATGVKQ